jgi:Fe-S-cluster containining protein
MPLFNCLCCGACCKNLIVTLDEKDGVPGKYKVGLMLLQEELLLFAAEDIKPMWAINTKGKRRANRPKVILYQMTRQTCPYITKTNRCLIYKRRPTICRGYPLMIHPNNTATLDLKCTACHKQNLYDTTNKVYKVFPEEIINAQLKLHRNMRTLFMTESYDMPFLFDLKTESWISLTDKDLQNMEPHPHGNTT